MQHPPSHGTPNGRRSGAERVEIEDTVVVETRISKTVAQPTEQREFEVVGIVEDADSAARYAICYSESADQFIVTDDAGTLLTDDALAQEVLDDFLQQTDQPEEDGA